VNKTYPPEFILLIDNLLKNEAQSFWKVLQNDPPVTGLRVNSQKTSIDEVQEIIPGEYQSLPWTIHGFAHREIQEPGKHPFHAAGLYYLQEPSAMAPVAVLAPQPGDRVLDLCAAPGGKTTQIQSWMGNRGILIANDPNPKRVQALCRNLERWGTRNAAVLCETPPRISQHLGEYFDRVLVDAPCSGEGTFRSDPGEIKNWSPDFSKRSCRIQDEILWYAAKLVRPGGVLVYSTCTFNQDENEGSIARFLDKRYDFRIDPIKAVQGFSPGIQLTSAPDINFSGTVRIWPHRTSGEGHFIARLRRSANGQPSSTESVNAHIKIDPNHLRIFSQFIDSSLISTPNTKDFIPESDHLSVFGNRLYWIPENMPSLAGLNVQHWGWWLGTIHGERFIPSPALAAGLNPEDVQKVLEFSLEDPGLFSYLRGSPYSGTKLAGLSDGWALVTCAGYSLGWGVIHRGRLKSYIPRWLRSH
jgi:NOL1/NOP2/sun family putative RNA methylase